MPAFQVLATSKNSGKGLPRRDIARASQIDVPSWKLKDAPAERATGAHAAADPFEQLLQRLLRAGRGCSSRLKPCIAWPVKRASFCSRKEGSRRMTSLTS